MTWRYFEKTGFQGQKFCVEGLEIRKKRRVAMGAVHLGEEGIHMFEHCDSETDEGAS